jgi:hypothetical protein
MMIGKQAVTVQPLADNNRSHTVLQRIQSTVRCAVDCTWKDYEDLQSLYFPKRHNEDSISSTTAGIYFGNAESSVDTTNGDGPQSMETESE